MKGIYKTKEGSKVEVIDFDEANKILMIKLNDSQNKWIDEAEYSTWVQEGENEAMLENEELVDEEAPIVEDEAGSNDNQEAPLKKKVVKKK